MRLLASFLMRQINSLHYARMRLPLSEENSGSHLYFEQARNALHYCAKLVLFLGRAFTSPNVN